MTIVIDHRSPSSRFGFVVATGRAVVNATKWLAAAIAREYDRRQTMSLLNMPECALRDIGLSRSDVYSALLTGTDERPSDRLASIRCVKRVAEREQIREARRSLD